MTSPHGSSSWVTCLQSTVSELVTELFNLLSSGEAGLLLLHLKNRFMDDVKVKDAFDSWLQASAKAITTLVGNNLRIFLETLHICMDVGTFSNCFLKKNGPMIFQSEVLTPEARLRTCRTISFRTLAILTLVVWWFFPFMRPMPSKYTWHHQAQHLGSC